jgi:hypothetical protein
MTKQAVMRHEDCSASSSWQASAKGNCPMLNRRYPLCILVFLFPLSCGSAPPKQDKRTPEEKPNVASAAAAASASEEDFTPMPVEPSKPKRHLGPGQCDDGFDCVDTVGFPRSGERWSCVSGKCVRAKMPQIGGVSSGQSSGTAAKAEETAAPAKKVKKTKKRRRRR